MPKKKKGSNSFSAAIIYRDDSRFMKSTQVTTTTMATTIAATTTATASAEYKTSIYYTDYEQYEIKNDDTHSGNDCNHNNDGDYSNSNDEDDDIYDNDTYNEGNAESETLSTNDESTSPDQDIANRIVGSLRSPFRTIKSVAIRPGPTITHSHFHRLENIPFFAITPSLSFPPTTATIIDIATTSSSANIAIITSTVITTTATTTTTTTTTSTTATTTTTTTSLPFIPVPIHLLVPEWNTRTKDSELSIQHQNYTLNITPMGQNSDSRQVIRNGLIEQLKCFHYFPNKQLNGYGEEVIKQIGVQDCLHNCILRVAFLCLSINYDNQTKQCILNGGNRIINNAVLIPSKSMDYYEYVCLSARKEKSKAENDRIGNYNISKLRECFSISENAVMYTLNGLVIDNIYTPLECLIACAVSHHIYKTKCYSVNWFKNTRICYLHTSKSSIRDLKPTASSDFFLNNCTDSEITLKMNSDCTEEYCDD